MRDNMAISESFRKFKGETKYQKTSWHEGWGRTWHLWTLHSTEAAPTGWNKDFHAVTAVYLQFVSWFSKWCICKSNRGKDRCCVVGFSFCSILSFSWMLMERNIWIPQAFFSCGKCNNDVVDHLKTVEGERAKNESITPFYRHVFFHRSSPH